MTHIEIIQVLMDPSSQERAIGIVDTAFSVFKDKKEMVFFMTRQLERQIGGSWQCIIGNEFHCVLKKKPFIYLKMKDYGGSCVVLFQ